MPTNLSTAPSTGRPDGSGVPLPDPSEPTRRATWHPSRTRNLTTMPTLNRLEAVGYARYSTGMQREESIERQDERIREAAAAQGVRIVEVYADRAVSGTRSDRDGLSAMLGFLRCSAHRPATVFVESADRLARELGIYVDLWEVLNRLGVTLHDVRTGVVDTPLKAALNGAVSEEERLAILKRTQSGREAHAAQGRVMAGVAYGYLTVPGSRGERVVCPVASAHVRRMFEMRAAGTSLREIASSMWEAGARIRDTQRVWHPVTVKGILSNPIYAGTYTYKRRMAVRDDLGRTITRNRAVEEIIQAPADHLRIVDLDVWDKVQALWIDDKRSPVPHAAAPYGKYLLQGKALCHVCGLLMRSTGAGKAAGQRWRCTSWLAGQSCGDPTSHDMVAAERQVLLALGDILDRDDFESHYVGSAIAAVAGHNARVQADLEALVTRIEAVEERINRSMEASFGAGFLPERARSYRERLERESAELEDRRNELRRSFKAVPENLSRIVELRGALADLAAEVPFVPCDTAGRTLKGALREIIGPVTVRNGEVKGTSVVDVEYRFWPGGVPDEAGTVRVIRTYHHRHSEKARTDLREQVAAAIEARTYEFGEERWSRLRPHLPAFVDFKCWDGEVRHRLLVEAIIVAWKTGADKSMVYAEMAKVRCPGLPTFGWKIQKLGGFEQLEEASRKGHLPECGPLDLSAHAYHRRPTSGRRKGAA